MHFQYIAVLLALCSPGFAKPHQFCACQSGTDDSINIDATLEVHGKDNSRYIWAQEEGHFWIAHDSGPGPRFAGAFLKAAKGWIDGDTFYKECRRYGGADSTCFNCSEKHLLSDGKSIVCDQT
ncbi:uncharacterized protein RAG0_07799 [Rhynchosporium agropyri]|uniref:Uncharacterized protein n=1 Tax=Rhynchosporium agropyri TaxID=914238 RepID=A0A1E1KN66_9HELO|nr:uncharacterized protein RAG0_07799 [Rhynchosporium agropyri]